MIIITLTLTGVQEALLIFLFFLFLVFVFSSGDGKLLLCFKHNKRHMNVTFTNNPSLFITFSLFYFFVLSVKCYTHLLPFPLN